MRARLKLWLPVAIVVTVLAAGYVVSTLLAEDDTPSSSAETATATPRSAQPASTRTPGQTRAASTATQTSRPGSATSTLGAERRDLSIDERRGGHTLERHVGRS